MIRVTSPVYPEKPYAWGVASEGQCTWYAYWRVQEMGYTPPCYWDRETKTGSYTNAKYWLDNYREPWVVKDIDYTPVAGDIAVFTGTYGHVIVIEDINGTALISEYNRLQKLGFDNDFWTPGSQLSQCGALIGYLHYENKSVEPVERNIYVDQIQTTDTSLRVRLEPSLDGEYFCNVKLGYYNVLSQTEADGYIWYEIEKGKYCANITTIFLPKEDNEIEILRKENEELKLKLSEINKLSEV